ncbi:MAG: hypothetical protein HOP07_13290 [Bacteriovoracaceae bacterium]|nr:hypothetical protein [Bacteriovoracaceae bacterium]
METITKNRKQEYLSDFAVLLKKMRLLKKLTRQQAGLLFDFSFILSSLRKQAVLKNIFPFL